MPFAESLSTLDRIVVAMVFSEVSCCRDIDALEGRIRPQGTRGT
jgi:hypothetical protein